MASKWTVIVFCLFHCAFADICNNLGAIRNCDDCMRCGAVWCKKPGDGVRCAKSTDDWCPDITNVYTMKGISTSGDYITPKFEQRSMFIGESSEIIIDYLVKSPVPKPNVTVNIVDSTVKGFQDRLNFKHQLNRNSCRKKTTDYCVKVDVLPEIGFCPHNGTAKEIVTLSIKIDGISEETTAKLHIPCSCACEAVEKDSMKCNAHGDFTTCGTCNCHQGWEGEYCETKISDNELSFPAKGVPSVKGPGFGFPSARHPLPNYYGTDECPERGDTISCIHPKTDLLCSNNGRCCDGICQCDQRLPGFLDFDEYCADLCTATSVCDACLLNPVVGKTCPASDCSFSLMVEEPDKSVIAKSIQYTWTMCNITAEGCHIDYAVMRDKNRNTHVMVLKSSCGETAQFVYKVTVPVVATVLAVVALLSVAAFMVYKNRLPGLPMSEPQYADIHAEDSTGINPLYKPPTSSFKNPTYGSKW